MEETSILDSLPKWASVKFPCRDEILKKKRSCLLKRLHELTKNQPGEFVVLHPSDRSQALWDTLKASDSHQCPEKISVIGLIRSMDVSAYVLADLISKAYSNMSSQHVLRMVNNYETNIKAQSHSKIDKDSEDFPSIVTQFELQLKDITRTELTNVCEQFCTRMNVAGIYNSYLDWFLTLGVIPYFNIKKCFDYGDLYSNNSWDSRTHTKPLCAKLANVYIDACRILKESKSTEVCDPTDCAIVMSTSTPAEISAIRLSDGKVLRCLTVYRPYVDVDYVTHFTSPCAHVVDVQYQVGSTLELHKSALSHNAMPFRVLLAKHSDKQDVVDSGGDSDELLKDILEALNSNDSENIKSIKSLVKYTLALKSSDSDDAVKTITSLLSDEDINVTTHKTKTTDFASVTRNNRPVDEGERLAVYSDFEDNPLSETIKEYNIRYNVASEKTSLHRSSKWQDESRTGTSVQQRLWVLSQQLMKEKSQNDEIKMKLKSTVKEYLRVQKEMEKFKVGYFESVKKIDSLIPLIPCANMHSNHYKENGISESLKTSLCDLPLMGKRKRENERHKTAEGAILNVSKVQKHGETVHQSIIAVTAPDIEAAIKRLGKHWNALLTDVLHFVSIRTYSNQVLSAVPTARSIQVLIKPYFKLLQLEGKIKPETILLHDQERLPSDLNIRILNDSIYAQSHIGCTLALLKGRDYAQTCDIISQKSMKPDSRLGNNIDHVSEISFHTPKLHND